MQNPLQVVTQSVTQLKVVGLFKGMEPIAEKFPESLLAIDRNGVIGDRFYGPTRISRRKGIHVPNDRMWSAVSVEDAAFVLAYWNKLLKDKGSSVQLNKLEIGWFGPNICFQGMEAFSLIPPGTRLVFDNGVVLVVAENNPPCMTAANFIAEQYPDVDIMPELFVKAALMHRGVVGYVEDDGFGFIKFGEQVAIEYPSLHLATTEVENLTVLTR